MAAARHGGCLAILGGAAARCAIAISTWLHMYAPAARLGCVAGVADDAHEKPFI